MKRKVYILISMAALIALVLIMNPAYRSDYISQIPLPEDMEINVLHTVETNNRMVALYQQLGEDEENL